MLKVIPIAIKSGFVPMCSNWTAQIHNYYATLTRNIRPIFFSINKDQ